MKDNRPFPIQRDKTGEASFIPWWLAEIAYKHYSIKKLWLRSVLFVKKRSRRNP